MIAMFKAWSALLEENVTYFVTFDIFYYLKSQC